MDHHEAYRSLQELLERLRHRPYGELRSLVGRIETTRVTTESGATIVLEWCVDSAPGDPSRLVIRATADSPDWFRVDRLEERVFVHEP